MDASNITVGLALLVGLASFLSPCVLALVLAYVGCLSGRSVTTSGIVVEHRWVIFSHGVALVLGFSAIFVSLGAAAGAIGVLLFDVREWIPRIGGVVVILFGLHTMGMIHIPLLEGDTRRQSRPKSIGFLSSGLMGVFFSAGWAPCVGLVLGAVLTLAINGTQLAQGVILLSVYSLGLAIPFLLAALGIGRVTELLRKHNSAIRYLSIGMGTLLVIVVVMLLTGTLEQLARLGFQGSDLGEGRSLIF